MDEKKFNKTRLPETTPNEDTSNASQNTGPAHLASVEARMTSVAQEHATQIAESARRIVVEMQTTSDTTKTLAQIANTFGIANKTSILSITESLKNPLFDLNQKMNSLIPKQLESNFLNSYKNTFEQFQYFQPPVSAAFQKLFETPQYLDAFTAIKPTASIEIYSNLFKQAFEPPPSLSIFSDAIKSSFETQTGLTRYTDLFKNYNVTIPEYNYVNSVWNQFNSEMDENWESVLKLSAKAAGLTALRQWPEDADLIQPNQNEIESDSSQFDTLDEARQSVFSLLEIEGKKPPRHVQDAFRFLFQLETEIRRFIHNVMTQEVGIGWEKRRLPEPMYLQWTQKHSKAVKYGRDPSTALIEFADFTDYNPIITSNKNWEIFKIFFQHQNITEASFQRLFPYRLDTMHAREFKKEELVIVAGDCEWLLKRLGSSLFETK